MSGQGAQQGLVKRQFGHRARLALAPSQVMALDAQGHAARATWNLLHDWWLMLPRAKRTLAAADAVIRQGRAELEWLGVLPAQAAQAVLKSYFQAWKNCWEGRAGAPEFKARFRTRMSIDIPQGRDLHVVRVHRRWGMVNIPKVGRIRFRWTRDLPAGKHASKGHRITGARLVKDAVGWHIAFRITTLASAPALHCGPEVGIDAGIAVPLALSDGENIEHAPWLSKKEEERLLYHERRAARRKAYRTAGARTSRRLQQTYDQIARIRATAKRRREDWQHKTTTSIAEVYGTVVVEALHIANMTRSAKGTIEAPGSQIAQKAGLNRSILGEAWGRTVRLLAYKVADRGGVLAEVPAPGTSQECHRCHTVTPGSRRNQAEFVCRNPACGWEGNADTNAARIVLYRYRTGHALVPAAGRAVVRRAANGVKPATAR
ncbi:RNA-guided endonuclease InsQ/TnpB family protein [Streptomyces sp. NPDC058686]|uniref:RNA-guided endonuclease InsQ/TnpB family protein n=1 Tax=Streptomyces sp. NPDC058686 TaxID=3346599 RepID=UPI00364FDE56